MELFHTNESQTKERPLTENVPPSDYFTYFMEEDGEKTCKIIIINMKNACVYDNYTFFGA